MSLLDDTIATPGMSRCVLPDWSVHMRPSGTLSEYHQPNARITGYSPVTAASFEQDVYIGRSPMVSQRFDPALLRKLLLMRLRALMVEKWVRDNNLEQILISHLVKELGWKVLISKISILDFLVQKPSHTTELFPGIWVTLVRADGEKPPSRVEDSKVTVTIGELYSLFYGTTMKVLVTTLDGLTFSKFKIPFEHWRDKLHAKHSIRQNTLRFYDE